jgi:hypothetical protein
MAFASALSRKRLRDDGTSPTNIIAYWRNAYPNPLLSERSYNQNGWRRGARNPPIEFQKLQKPSIAFRGLARSGERLLLIWWYWPRFGRRLVKLCGETWENSFEFEKTYLLPATWSSALIVLDQEMTGSNLSVGSGSVPWPEALPDLMAWELLDLVVRHSIRRIPEGFFGRCGIKVRTFFRIWKADFPRWLQRIRGWHPISFSFHFAVNAYHVCGKQASRLLCKHKDWWAFDRHRYIP